jgi:hypothetical protein
VFVEVFADLFDYGYTNTMEAELDKIEYAVNGDSGIEIYENLCGKTLEDIKSRLTAIKNIKVEYRIDENHVLCFGQSGPCIKHDGAARQKPSADGEGEGEGDDE